MCFRGPEVRPKVPRGYREKARGGSEDDVELEAVILPEATFRDALGLGVMV